MGKRGNPNLNNNAEQKKERTKSLIREAVKLLEENFEIKSIPAVSEKTKEIDPSGKGLSEAAFRNKELEHVQELMRELGIGKYEGLKVGGSEDEAELADLLLQVKKELDKANKMIAELKKQKKKLSEKIDKLVIDNEELRGANYELQMKTRLKMDFKVGNNMI
ncbi:MAG: hypothetical protein M1300_06940 [Epsilonproteobacteria bacterium]|nr:hypothetical protein [Campylobacterota bacterium]